MKYLIGAVVALALLTLPVILTEQGRNTTSCMIDVAIKPAYDQLEWEWCVWAFHDVDNTHYNQDVIQFKLKEVLDDNQH